MTLLFTSLAQLATHAFYYTQVQINLLMDYTHAKVALEISLSSIVQST